jgi:hypothetical protein
VNHFAWLPEPARPLLLRHLSRVREAMQGLSERSREALARALAAVVAGLVCEAVAGALAGPARRSTHDAWPRRERRPGAPLMDVFDERVLEEPDYPPEDWDESLLTRPAARRGLDRLPPAAWPTALAVGLRTTAWWLGRSQGRGSLAAALGVGTATVVGAVLGGPLALAGLSLVESLLGLASLDTAACAAAALAGRDDTG